MANGAFVNISLILGLLNLVGLMIVVILPQWRVNSVVASEPNMQMMRYREGLWLRCTSFQDAYFNCDTYDTSIIGLAAYLNAFRALMIIALLCSVTGVVCSAIGMKCATMMEEDSKQKRWVVIVGGILHIVAGVLTGICVSWYAAEVVREYYSQYYVNQKMKYTLGPCLYVGWVCMLVSLICGALMACCTCFSKPPEDKQAAYVYKPTTANEKYSLPPVTTTPAYKPITTSYDRQPADYHRSDSSYRHHSSRHGHHGYTSSSHHGSHRSVSSHSSHHHRDSPKSSRHEGDITRASGFV